MTVRVDSDDLRLSAQKVRAIGFLLRHFNTGAALDADEAVGLGAILEDLAEEIEEVLG